MTITAAIGDHLGLLDKERIIAPADYNRWLVPPAALAIHIDSSCVRITAMTYRASGL
jgi:hypothetical protein